ncbi:MAG: hypothetical protein Q9160_004925 [Pyrenula sp. 1 TL-2023]
MLPPVYIFLLGSISIVFADFNQCSDNPLQQPYRWLTDNEYLSLAAGIIDDMFQPSPNKRSEDPNPYPRSAKYSRQMNSDAIGGGQESWPDLSSDVQMDPPSQTRLSADSRDWASLTPAQYDMLERGLRLAQAETFNRVIDTVGRTNEEINRQASRAIEAIGQVAAQRTEEQVRKLLATVAYSISNSLDGVTQTFRDALAQHLQQSGEQWSTQISALTVDRVKSIGLTIDDKLSGLIDAVADQVTEGSREMDTRKPPAPFKGRLEVLNKTIKVVYQCGAKTARIFRCIFLCNMNAGDRATRTRTACQNFLQIISLGTVAIGGLILLLNRLQLPIRGTTISPIPGNIPPPLPNTTIGRDRVIEIVNSVASFPAPKKSNSTSFPTRARENSSTPLPGSDAANSTIDSAEDAYNHVQVVPVTLNVRVVSRGRLPDGLPVGEDPKVTQLGDDALPDYASKWITHQKPPCTDPPSGPNGTTPIDNKSKQPRNKRDDPNDNQGLPTNADDFQGIIWNLMWTQFFPQMNQGIMSASYSLYNEALEGSEDIYQGGALKVMFWVTEEPDIDGMKYGPDSDRPDAARGNDLSRAPSWTYREHSTVYGQECFDNYSPANATTIYSQSDGVPTKNWLFAFNDACKNAFGGTKPTMPKDFIYAGPGYKSDPENGVGWNGTYHAEGCQYEVQCSDLLGLNGITNGDLSNHFNHCKSVTQDKRYHGGMFYHSKDLDGGRYGKNRRRDDPWVPNRCGYLQIEPLGVNGVEVQTGGPQKQPMIPSDELR